MKNLITLVNIIALFNLIFAKMSKTDRRHLTPLGINDKNIYFFLLRNRHLIKL